MSPEATELALYLDNEEPLYRQKLAIFRALAKKKDSSKYNRTLASKAFASLMGAAAKKYVREFGAPGDRWNIIFSPSTAAKPPPTTRTNSSNGTPSTTRARHGSEPSCPRSAPTVARRPTRDRRALRQKDREALAALRAKIDAAKAERRVMVRAAREGVARHCSAFDSGKPPSGAASRSITGPSVNAAASHA